MDGNVLDEPLSASGHNRAWLHSELENSVLLLKMSSSVKWIHTDNLLSTFTMTNPNAFSSKQTFIISIFKNVMSILNYFP